MKLASELDAIFRRLRPLVFRNPSNEVAQWEERRKHQVSELLSRNVNRAREMLAELDELRCFAEPVSINTLRSWGEQPGCPLPRYFKRAGHTIAFGRNAEQCLTIAVPESLKFPIGRIDFWTDLKAKETVLNV